MKLLVVNPNTSQAMTETLRRSVSATVGDGVTVRAVTARFGASYIAGEAGFAVACHATLDAYAHFRVEHAEPDAVLIGCFGDPGIDALREITGRPVIGLAEAALHQAARHGRFAIVTGGAAWKPMLMRLVRALGFAEALAAIHVVAPTGAQLAADPTLALSLLRDACRDAAVGADCVILGGAGLAGMAAGIAADLDVPLIDSVVAGAQASAEAAAQVPLALAPREAGSVVWQGLSGPLLQRLG
jgi:Asp/Glu/hydantoin racemase